MYGVKLSAFLDIYTVMIIIEINVNMYEIVLLISHGRISKRFRWKKKINKKFVKILFVFSKDHRHFIKEVNNVIIFLYFFSIDNDS